MHAGAGPTPALGGRADKDDVMQADGWLGLIRDAPRSLPNHVGPFASNECYNHPHLQHR